MNNIPTGLVSFLFTDIEGSTRLSQEFPETLQFALERHNVIMHNAIESNNGFVFEIVGDAFCCAFQKAEDAVKAAVDAQLNLAKEKWDEAVIKVRIGIHSGNAEWNGTAYMNYITLSRTDRIMSAGYGEQIIISENVYELAKDVLSVPNQEIGNEGSESIPNQRGGISFRDLGERRLKDVTYPIKLYQVISPGLRKDFPPLKTLGARPNNLPVQITSFVGRKEVLRQVSDLFKQTRMLTITGSGGSGKTRLAMQVGADMIDDFANGVFIAELAPVSDPSFIIQTLMNSLGVKEEAGRSLEDTITGYLKDKEILLILDNCEHLISECAGLSEMLLSKCFKLRIIATSREALNCQAEQRYPIPSLSLPDTSVNNSPEQLIQYESVRLFMERATSVNQNFRLDNTNAQALAEICCRLDGIPLAIELAASRTKIMTAENINKRLDDRFKLLTGGTRSALPRQQTLRATIDWSYDLLTEEEKTFWKRSSIFVDGWTLESAEDICTDEKIRGGEIIDLLGQLAGKSIIMYDEVNERYSILETLKQYGEEKLMESDESELFLTRHLKYFTELAEISVNKLNGSEVQVWLERLESEHGNFQSAINYSLHCREKDQGARLAGALGTFWFLRCYYSTGRQLLEKFLNDTGGITKFSLAKLFLYSGMLSNIQGENEHAQKYFEESIRLNRETGNKKGIASTLNALGNLVYNLGNYEQALELYEESVEVRREIGDKVGMAVVLTNLGNVAVYLGNNDKAQKFYEESLAINRDTGNKNQIAACLSNLGNLASCQGNYELARKFDEESLTIRRELGYKHGIAHSLFNLGSAAYLLGSYAEAQKFLEESLAIRRELGDKHGIAETLFKTGYVNFDIGKYEEAAILYEESLALNRELGEKGGIAVSLSGLGQAAFNLGNLDESEKLIEESLEIRRKIQDKSGIAYSLFGLGNVANYNGNYEAARKFYEESIEIRRGTGDRQGLAYSLHGLANASLNFGNYEQATTLCEESLRLRIELRNKSRISESLILFAGILNAGNQISHAVILLGAADTALSSAGAILQRTDLKMQEQILSELHNKLSDEEFLKYYEEGKKLTLKEAAQLAMNKEQ